MEPGKLLRDFTDLMIRMIPSLPLNPSEQI